MRFSTHSNNIFKEFFKSNVKEKIIENIKKEKEMITSEIKDFINDSYSAPVEACDSLDILVEKINNLKMINNEVERVSNELMLDLNENKEQERDLKQCLDRISIIQKEIITISKFLDVLTEVETTIDTGRSSFLIAKDLTFLDETLKSLQKYFFYISFRDRVETIKEKLKKYIETTIDEFLNKNWTEVGRKLSITDDFKLFDEIQEQESMLNPAKMLDVIYYSKIFPGYIESTIDGKRKSMFRNAKKDEIVYFYIGNVFLSGFLQKYVQIETFYSQIFTEISEMRSVNINACVKLKKLINRMGIMSEDLNHAIGTAVYVYFEEYFKPADLNKLSGSEIIKKIEEGATSLAKMNSYENEFDEIFLKKIDDSLVYILNSSDENVFFRRLEDTKNILLKLESLKLGDYPFEVKHEIERSIFKMANKSVESLNQLDPKDVVEKIIGWKKVDSVEFKEAVIKILEDRSNELFSEFTEDERVLFIDTAKRNLQ